VRAQIILKWNIQRGVPVLVKAASLGHLKENLDVFDWKLDETEKVVMDGLNENKRFICPDWHVFPDSDADGETKKPSKVLGNGALYN